MSVWIISDTHLGHDKMVEFCGRPKNHSEIILENLKDIPGGTFIHLGDICIGNDAEWHKKLMEVLAVCECKILIKGNHDNKSERWYRTHGWNMVFRHTGEVMQFFGKQILFSHEPQYKIKSQNGGEVDLNIHGHLHNGSHRMDDEMRRWYDKKYHHLVEIETNGYKPILLERFLKNE